MVLRLILGNNCSILASKKPKEEQSARPILNIFNKLGEHTNIRSVSLTSDKKKKMNVQFGT